MYRDLNLARLFIMSSCDQISSETDVAKINPSIFSRGEFSPSNKIVRVHSGFGCKLKQLQEKFWFYSHSKRLFLRFILYYVFHWFFNLCGVMQQPKKRVCYYYDSKYWENRRENPWKYTSGPYQMFNLHSHPSSYNTFDLALPLIAHQLDCASLIYKLRSAIMF